MGTWTVESFFINGLDSTNYLQQQPLFGTLSFSKNPVVAVVIHLYLIAMVIKELTQVDTIPLKVNGHLKQTKTTYSSR